MAQKIERWLLGSIIARNELIEIAFNQQLAYLFFDDSRHAAIFAVMTELHKKGSSIGLDSIMLAYEQLPEGFTGKGTLTSDYLTELMDAFSPLPEPYWEHVFEHLAKSHFEFMHAAHMYFASVDGLVDAAQQGGDISSLLDSGGHVN